MDDFKCTIYSFSKSFITQHDIKKMDSCIEGDIFLVLHVTFQSKYKIVYNITMKFVLLVCNIFFYLCIGVNK